MTLPNRHNRYNSWEVAWRLLAICASMVVFLAVTSCRTISVPEIVEVPQTETKIEYRDRLQRDTCFVHDSIFIFQKGDTLRIERWRDRYVERLRTDTLYVFQADTFTIVKPVYVERRLGLWDSFKLRTGGWLWLLVLIVLLLFVAWHYVK